MVEKMASWKKYKNKNDEKDSKNEMPIPTKVSISKWLTFVLWSLRCPKNIIGFYG